MKMISMQKTRGFTLMELLVVLMIVAIMGSWALPTYRAYVNEADAARVIADLHGITSAYHHAFLAGLVDDGNVKEFKSPGFGQPPTAFSSLGGLYTGPQGVTISTQVINHSGYFNVATSDFIPVAFIQGPKDVLDAVDGVTGGEHRFVNDHMLLVSLADLAVTRSMAEISSALAQTSPGSTNIGKVTGLSTPPATKPAEPPTGTPDVKPDEVIVPETSGSAQEPKTAVVSNAGSAGGTREPQVPASSSSGSGSHPLTADSCPLWPPGHRKQCLRALGL
jgi:prepilin-type N-terminal cleavage/methylation domain-containing protein